MLLPVIKTDSHSTAGFYTFPKEVRGKEAETDSYLWGLKVKNILDHPQREVKANTKACLSTVCSNWGRKSSEQNGERPWEAHLFDAQERRLPSRPLLQPQLQTLMDHVQQDSAEHQEGGFKGGQVHGL